MIPLLLLISFLFYEVSAISPRLSRGGCLVVEDELYYLGGKIFMPNIQINGKDNNKAFHLNLKKGFKLSNNEAEWNETNIVNPPKTMNTPKLFYTNDSNNIISIYENGGSKRLAFNYFNIKESKWHDEYIINDLYKEYELTNEEISKGSQTLYILQDENNKDRFYISGFLFQYSSAKYFPLHLRQFNIQTKKVEILYKPLANVYIYQSFILNNKLYYFEIPATNEIAYYTSFSRLHAFDLTTKQMESHQVGFDKYVGFQTIRFNHDVYHLWLDPKKPHTGDIYKFKMNPFSFEKVLEGVQIGRIGCFITYNNYAINSFGLNLINDKNPGKVQSSNYIELFNMSNWKQVDYLPPLIKEDNIDDKSDDGVNNNDKESNNGPLIGGIIGGVIGFIIISVAVFFVLYKYKLKKKKTPSIIIEPIVIEPINPLDINTDYHNTDLFNHFHEIDNDGSMLPIETEPRANRNIHN